MCVQCAPSACAEGGFLRFSRSFVLISSKKSAESVTFTESQDRAVDALKLVLMDRPRHPSQRHRGVMQFFPPGLRNRASPSRAAPRFEFRGNTNGLRSRVSRNLHPNEPNNRTPLKGCVRCCSGLVQE